MFEWLNKDSRKFLARGYLKNDQLPEERIKEITETFRGYIGSKEIAYKFYKYLGKGYYSLSSPVWSNYGTNRGLPVSCFGSYIEDSTASILSAHSEIGIMNKMGGGAAAYFGNVRGRGSPIGQDKGESFGSVNFMEMLDNLVKVISQGKVRRVAFSPYLPIEHPDALEFIRIGEEGHPIQGLTHGVTVTNEFIEKLYSGDLEARTKWAEVIKARGERGYPYIIFIDNINDNTVGVYKDKNRKIVASNLC